MTTYTTKGPVGGGCGHKHLRSISRHLLGLGKPCLRCGSEHYRDSDLGSDWPRECEGCGLGEGEDPPADD